MTGNAVTKNGEKGHSKKQGAATLRLAEYVSALKFDDLPGEVIGKSKQLLRDGLGNQLAASTLADPARIAIGLLKDFGGTPDATVVGYGFRLPTPHAALSNAMLAHGVELDDAHGNALTKAGSVIVPSVLAVAETFKKNGSQTLASLVAAYDVMIRIGLAINPSHRRRGFHTTGTAGTFAAAAATANLLGLDATRTAWALGLAGMQAAGLQAFLADPCMAKPFSPGKAAFNGVMAGLLAARGFTGPRFVLEGYEGFFAGYSDESDITQLLDGLGEQFKISEVAFKPHAACRYAHGPIDAMQIMVMQHDLHANDIERVVVKCCELAIRQSGRVEVPNLNAAMGSTPYGLAVAISQRDNGLGAYKEAFTNPENQELARKVRMEPDPACGVMGRAATVEVFLNDGRIISHHVAGPKGEPEFPLSEHELKNKYLSLATMAIDRVHAERLATEIAQLENCDDVGRVMALTAFKD